MTESLAIVWNVPTPIRFTKSGCFPACSDFYHGTISCGKDFPRNLNAGTWSIPIPKVGISLSINKLVSYWRSNDSNLFITWLPDKNRNSPGGQVGPIPGFSDWDVSQWAYPLTSTSTDAEFWINCTEQWGDVINADALAAGEGSDTPSTTAPSEPRNLRVSKAADGGIDGTWEAPASGSPSGVAGYFFSLIAWKPGEPRVFDNSWITPITATEPAGHILPAHIALMKKAAPTNYELTVVVGAVSREGSIGVPAIAPPALT